MKGGFVDGIISTKVLHIISRVKPSGYKGAAGTQSIQVEGLPLPSMAVIAKIAFWPQIFRIM